MKKLDRLSFEAICNKSSSPLVVTLEDGRMGMCNHWDDERVLIDVYRGNEHECVGVPFSNFIDTPMGLIVGLKGSERNADQ